MNTWPNGRRKALTQDEHESWNSRNYPGTRQLCTECGEPTGRCEDDSIYIEYTDKEVGPICEECRSKHWVCEECGIGVYPENVTFEETHEGCGGICS